MRLRRRETRDEAKGTSDALLHQDKDVGCACSIAFRDRYSNVMKTDVGNIKEYLRVFGKGQGSW